MGTYEIFLAHTADAVCELDGLSKVLRGNPAFERLVGGALEREGMTFFDVLDSRDRETAVLQVQGLAASNPSVSVEARFPGGFAAMGAGDGLSTPAWMIWQLTWISQDHRVAVGRDVSVHHRTAQELEEKSFFLHSIIDAEPECVKVVSRTGELLDINRAGLQMIGAESSEAAIGRCLYDLVAPEDRERFAAFNESVCDGQGGELKFELIGLDGSRRSMETKAVPLSVPPSGQFASFEGELLHLAITRDVTQRHLLERQLLQAQKLEAVGLLAAGVAHDFNNLLTAILGPATVALQALGEDSEVSEDLRQIKSAGERAARLTQQLLVLGKRQVVRLKPMSLVEVVLDMQEMIGRVLGETFRLEIDIAEPVDGVCADRGQVEQVLLNLVVNARDASGGRGHIQIGVANRSLSTEEARLLVCAPGKYVALSVRDHGSGFGPEVRQHLFDPFFTTKAPGEGSGLGLSTCYGIVIDSSGAFEVESEEGTGSTFTVLLPAAQEPDPLELAHEDLGPGHPSSILVVEDEPLVLKSLVRMLTSLGHEVYEAPDAETALVLAEGLGDISLLVTDISMPGMGGVELSQNLMGQRPELKVLLITGYVTPKWVLEGAMAGRLAVLQKPFGTQELSRAVAAMLGAAEAKA